jgi:hypothetical protein
VCNFFVRHILENAQNEPPPLTAEKHPQGDLFVWDVADAVLKDMMPQMEHPLYSLSKQPDMKVRRYEHNGNWLEISQAIREAVGFAHRTHRQTSKVE